MSHFLQPNIILLKEGTDTSQGVPQLISNINACEAIVDTIRTTLGPRGMDKLIYNDRNATISNDGATIMDLLDIAHPAAKTLVEIAKSQDAEVGDGTTTVVLLAGQFLREAKRFAEDGVHPQTIIRGYRQACTLAREKLKELAVSFDPNDPGQMRELLEKCARTSLNSKLIAAQRKFFADMVVNSILLLDDDLDLDMVGVKTESGGALEDSQFIEGVAWKKNLSYAGHESVGKKFTNPKICLLNVELELKREKDNAELEISKVEDYQKMVDAEWSILYEKLGNIVDSGANVVLSRLCIGDFATQYFSDRGIFVSSRIEAKDMNRIAKATGGQIQSTCSNITPAVLGTCEVFEEKQLGDKRYNFCTGCPKTRSATILLRGGGEKFTAEAERSVHDAIMIVRRAKKYHSVVAGGGAIEMELSRHLKEFSRTIHGKEQLIINAFAKALEVIPRQLAENAGFDATDLLTKLRQKHYEEGGQWFGINVDLDGGICDTYESAVWEPSLVKLNSITAATEAAGVILSVDSTVKNPKAGGNEPPMPGGPGGMMR